MKHRTLHIAGAYISLTGIVLGIGAAAAVAVGAVAIAGCVLVEGVCACVASERRG